MLGESPRGSQTEREGGRGQLCGRMGPTSWRGTASLWLSWFWLVGFGDIFAIRGHFQRKDRVAAGENEDGKGEMLERRPESKEVAASLKGELTSDATQRDCLKLFSDCTPFR